MRSEYRCSNMVALLSLFRFPCLIAILFPNEVQGSFCFHPSAVKSFSTPGGASLFLAKDRTVYP
jgi:hypothetical protein